MTKAVYRPTMSSDTIFELVDLLENTKRTTGLSQNLRAFLNKLDSLAYDIGKGNRAPAYVATEVRKNAATAITLESLGGIEDGNEARKENEIIKQFAASDNHNPITSANNRIIQSAKPSADLDSEAEAQLEALEKEMLASLHEQGSPNVILEDRRHKPRD